MPSSVPVVPHIGVVGPSPNLRLWTNRMSQLGMKTSILRDVNAQGLHAGFEKIREYAYLDDLVESLPSPRRIWLVDDGVGAMWEMKKWLKPEDSVAFVGTRHGDMNAIFPNVATLSVQPIGSIKHGPYLLCRGDQQAYDAWEDVLFRIAARDKHYGHPCILYAGKHRVVAPPDRLS